MRALILGASGLVGHSLWREWKALPGWELFGTTLTHPLPGMEKLDIRDWGALKEAVSRARPDLLVLAAASPNVDFCETNPVETREVNVHASLRAADLAAKARARLVFFSSDYVFDGSKPPYPESAATNPLNEYGRQKLDAERGIAQAGSRHLILRISGVFGWEAARKNFVLQVLDRFASGQEVRAQTDIICRPTYAPNLAPVIAGLVEEGGEGVYHAVGADELSRYDLAVEAARVFGLDPKRVQPALAGDIPRPARRPPRASLTSERLPPELAERLWGARRALREMRKAAQPG